MNEGPQEVANVVTQENDVDKMAEIIEERNRLVNAVTQQPSEVLRDIAILAVGLAMHNVEMIGEMLEKRQVPSDSDITTSLIYGLRIVGLADGEYGHGVMMRVSNAGSQLFDTSTCSLATQLCESAEKEVDE